MFQANQTKDAYSVRREWVFLLLAGIFLGSLTMLNILGVSRFVDLSFDLWGTTVPFVFAVGVLPYPITFLCTDIISELYGKRRANMLVWIGLILNVWVLLVLWLGGYLDQPDLDLNGLIRVDGENVPYEYAFYFIRYLTFGSVLASMLAYLTAQFCDVHVFHWLKKRTKGKKMWLRNNVSTLTSQLVDSVAVILITHYFAQGLPQKSGYSMEMTLLIYIASSYLFKVFSALIDTIPFYLAVRYLSKYLKIDPNEGY